MNRTAALEIARSVRKRVHQGDCPTEPAHHAELIEEALIEMLNVIELECLGEIPDCPSCGYANGFHHSKCSEKTRSDEVKRLTREIGRLSAAMGSPAVHWNNKTSSIEASVIDEAIRRLSRSGGKCD